MSSYVPSDVPSSPAELPGYLMNEQRKVAEAMESASSAYLLVELAVAPTKPRPGIYLANGTSWNPGAGAGAYVYRGGAYHFLG